MHSIAILMCTYNGSAYLAEQLNSIQAQTYHEWKLYVSDDGSSDSTLEILHHFQKIWGNDRILIRTGPKSGFVQNFLSLASDSSIDADFFCFCDQDDVWLPQKLEASLNYHKLYDSNMPHLYGGRTILVNEYLKPFAMSPLFSKPCNFNNALVQSYAGGNTMMFNRSAKKIIERANTQNVPVHDWWIYLLISGAGGRVSYDSEPYVFYRQHHESLIGSNHSIMSKLNRLKNMISGQHKIWNDQNIEALNQVSFLLNKSSQRLLAEFKKLRRGFFLERLMTLKKSGLYRQTTFSTFLLYLSVLFNKT